MKKTIKGVIAPNLTFFKEDGSVDEEKCRKHMGWILDKGVNGLFVTGTYGSGYLMSAEERERIYEIAKSVSDEHRGTFVIAHVGCSDTATSKRLMKSAARIGLDGASAIAPYNYKYTEKELEAYYIALVSAADIPFYAYNNPDITGSSLSNKQVARLRNLGVRGLKDSAINLQLASAVINDNELSGYDFQYISGTTTGWPVFQKTGVDTMIAGMCNYAPEIAVGLYRLCGEDERKGAEAYRICAAVSALKKGNSLLSSHLALQARGFDAGTMRAPLAVNYDENRRWIEETADKLTHAIKEMEGL